MNFIFSKIIEFKVAEHYYGKNGEVLFIPVGKFSSYDIISQSKQLSFEIKFESRARDTFNLCFEYSYRGKASGLSITDAQMWVHVVPMDNERFCCYEFSVNNLKEVLKNFPEYRAGDDNQSVVRLLPLHKAEEIKQDKFNFTINWDEIKPYWA